MDMKSKDLADIERQLTLRRDWDLYVEPYLLDLRVKREADGIKHDLLFAKCLALNAPQFRDRIRLT